MASRTDANQAEIVAALRAVGASVQDLHKVGHGCPDLLVKFRNRLYLLECKTERGKFKTSQIDWMFRWGGDIFIVRTPDEALEAIGAERYTIERTNP